MAQGILPKDRNFISAIGGPSSASDTAASIRAFQHNASTRGMTVHIVGDDVGIGGGTQYTEDAAAAANPVGNVVNLIRNDTPATQTTADGDNIAQRGTNYGAAFVQLVTSAGAFIDSVGGGTQYATNVAYSDGNTGTLALTIRDDALSTLTEADGDYSGLRVDSTGALWAKFTNTTIAVTNAGTFVVQIDGSALTALQAIDTDLTTIIGHVDGIEALLGGTIAVSNAGLTELASAINASAQMDVNIAANGIGLATAAHQVTQNGYLDGIEALIGTTNTNTGASTTALQIMDDWDNGASDGASVSGDVAHDSADAGEPVKIGMRAFSPDGTTPGTAVAENDRTNAKGDLDGRLLISDEHPRWWSFHSDGSSALTDSSVQGDPGDGFQIVITEIMFSTGAATACNIFLEEGATKILGPWYLEAIAGRGLFWKGKKHVTASTAVTVTTSAAIAQSVDIQGYIQAV